MRIDDVAIQLVGTAKRGKEGVGLLIEIGSLAKVNETFVAEQRKLVAIT